MPVSRRQLISSGLAAGVVMSVPATAWADERPHHPLPVNPFTMGVASGDPAPDGFVLWTRLATNPLAEDGFGGMPDRNFDVKWQLATDDRFGNVIASGTEIATREWGYSIHIEVSGLESDQEYFYRFKTGRWHSPAARTRTTPALDAMPDSLTVAVVSCAQYEHGFFNAYRHLADQSPQLVVHLGDYYYEYLKNTYVSPDGNVRDHEGPEASTLASYRQRHGQYKLDPNLQAAHAVAPWLVVFDDHEVDNNWADENYEKPIEFPQPFFLERRKAAFRAYYENMPLRTSAIPQGIDMQLYRRVHWGQLATFHMMDTRQYRSVQGCGGGWQSDCEESRDPARSITGDAQEEWLIDGFHTSGARWDLLGQQVFFSQRDNNSGPVKTVSMDAWDGYAASRDRITRGLVDAGVRNPVVLTGDVHTAWANELKLDYDDPTTESIGVELVATSLSTGGNGADSIPSDSPFLKINPHIKFYNRQRGYVSTTITPDQLDVDFEVVPLVTVPNSVGYTRASYSVVDREHLLHETYSRPVDLANIETFDPKDPVGDTHEDDDDKV